MQYRKYGVVFAIFLMFIALLTGCGRNPTDEQISSSRAETVIETVEKGQAAAKESVTEAIADTEISTDAPEDYIKTSYMANTKVLDVIEDPVFQGYGRLIFPAGSTIN
jgi:hypothetical protein